MLDGILTTALQIIIVLDICGAVIYFLMSGASKAKEKGDSSLPPVNIEAPLQASAYSLANQPQPAMAGASSVEQPPVSEWVTHGDRSATQIYGFEGATEVAPVSLIAQVRSFFSSVRSRLSRHNTQETGKSADLKSDRARLEKVLDSFREEMQA
ncbi:MAG: hypothetical protein CME21_15640 [Gemmatimonadetes bacterium]|nr:hypothetical protein [Gemmatimonadota bacterium]HCK09285.1 hypothetical protein [Candidatus Latescibacterota bacterium]